MNYYSNNPQNNSWGNNTCPGCKLVGTPFAGYYGRINRGGYFNRCGGYSDWAGYDWKGNACSYRGRCCGIGGYGGFANNNYGYGSSGNPNGN